MPNAYTGTGSSTLGGTVGGAGSVADKRPARQSIPGSTVVLQKYVDLSKATTALTEDTDPDAVALSTPTSVTITLNEYGNSVLVTRALELFSLADVDPAIANIIAFNLADSIDEVAMTTYAVAQTSSTQVQQQHQQQQLLLLQQSHLQTFVAQLRNSALTRLQHARVHSTGLVSTQKFHTTSALRQVLQDGFFLTSTVPHRTASGLEKSEHTKVHTSLSLHVFTQQQTVLHLQRCTAQLFADSKHLQKQLQKSHTSSSDQ
jgi:hypothetical protein